MGLSTVYDVVTRYRVDAGRANQQIMGVTGSMNTAAMAADRLKGSIGGIFTGLSVAGIGAALGGLAKKVIDLNKSATETQVNISSVLTLNNLGDFEYNMGRARSIMAGFRQDARQTKGSSADLANIFTTVLPGLASINPSNDAAREFTRRGAGAANVLLGGDYDLAGSQLLQILGGQAGSDNRLFQAIRKPLFEELGIKGLGSEGVKEFNKLAEGSKQKLFDALNNTLGSFDAANAQLMNTVDGQWATFTDNINNMIREGGAPIADLVRDTLADVNKWLDENGESAAQLAKDLGQGVVDGLNKVGQAAKFAYNNMELLVTSGGALLALRTLGTTNVVNGISNFGPMIAAQTAGLRGVASGAMRRGSQRMSALGSFLVPSALRATDSFKYGSLGGKVRQAALLGRWRASSYAGQLAGSALDFIAPAQLRSSDAFRYAGRGRQASMIARAGAGRARAGLSMALGLTDLMGTDRYRYASRASRGLMVTRTAGGRVLGGIRGAAGSLIGMAGIKGLMTTMAPMLKLLGPLAVGFAALYGAMRVLKDENNSYTKDFRESTGGLMKQLDAFASRFSGGEGGIVAGLKNLSEWLGEKLLWVISRIVDVVSLAVEGFNKLAMLIEMIGTAAGLMYGTYHKAGGGLKGIAAIDVGESFLKAQLMVEEKERQRMAAAEVLEKKREQERKAEIDRKKKEENADGNKKKTDVNITLKQEIKSDASPDRIAYRTLDLLEDAVKNRRTGVEDF